MRKADSNDPDFIAAIRGALRMVTLAMGLLVGVTVFFLIFPNSYSNMTSTRAETSRPWKAPDIGTISVTASGRLILYGQALIMNTASYLGPEGTVRKMSNGMTCQNCHLDAGTRHYGNNFSAVASTYPKFRSRSGSVESIEKRVNDCFERSLNGSTLDHDSPEMRAIVAYIQWVGKNVKPGEVPGGSGLAPLEFLDRAASPEKGKVVFEQKCVSCHGSQGEGLRHPDSSSWENPPLWGDNSYNIGAGLYRLSCFAEFVKTNMPIGATVDAPQLSDEEAWDVAAYVNSMPRPSMKLENDWPDISTKPVDYPFGPYADRFSDEQHKFGPFRPIHNSKKK